MIGLFMQSGSIVFVAYVYTWRSLMSYMRFFAIFLFVIICLVISCTLYLLWSVGIIMFVKCQWEHSWLVFFCLSRSRATTVGKGISTSVTTFVFILQGTKLAFRDGVVLCFEVERVVGFLSEKYENNELNRTVV